VSQRFLRDITADALAALEAANEPEPSLFRRGDVLVHVARRSSSALEARPVRHAGLKGLLDRAADFVRVKMTKLGPVAEPARPPDDVVADILSLATPPLPALRDIAAAPLVLPDGRTLRASGYDAASGFLLDLRGLEGARDDLSIREAADLLSDQLLVDFPFADEASLAHAVGMLVQSFARPLISGPTPSYLIEAPAQGTGKGLLAELVGVVADGRDPAVMSLSGNEEEIDKRVTALLIAAARIILLDNVTAIRSPTIAAALTATTWRGRVLGRSQMAHVPNTALWLATGNNVELSKEMGRRVVSIRLDAGVEHPEDRAGFKHALPGWALQHRVELVTGCLSLVTRWLDAGRPAGPSSLGRYESWAEVIGGIVSHAGFDGFLSNRADRIAAADRESAEWAALATAWWQRWTATPIAAAAVLDLASEHGLLLDLYAGRSKLSALQRMGRALASRRDAVVGTWVIRSAGQDSRTHNPSYRLEQHSRGPGRPENMRNATNAPDQGGRDRVFPGGQAGQTLQTPGPARETPGSPDGDDQIAGAGAPGVCSVSHVSERPHPDPRELVAGDVAFIAAADGRALDAAEVAGRLLAERPELGTLGNVERLAGIAAILRRRAG
jgi:hypothetical protein